MYFFLESIQSCNQSNDSVQKRRWKRKSCYGLPVKRRLDGFEKGPCFLNCKIKEGRKDRKKKRGQKAERASKRGRKVERVKQKRLKGSKGKQKREEAESPPKVLTKKGEKEGSTSWPKPHFQRFKAVKPSCHRFFGKRPRKAADISGSRALVLAGCPV